RTVIVLTTAVFVLAGAGFAFIPQQFFPSSDRPKILADLWLPEGTSYKETEMQAKRLEERLLASKETSAVTAFIGDGIPRFFLPLDQKLRNQNFAQFLIIRADVEKRDGVIEHIRGILASVFPAVRFKVDRLFLGPPVGWPVQIRVLGPDRDEVRRI